MLGWCADSLRFLWSLLYWNTRKTLYRIKGAKGPAPCQNPSDSGVAGATGCDACLGWNRRARFRRVCPLLAPDAEGEPRCSVDAADVRPFWGRAVLMLAAGLVVSYILAVCLAFGLLRWRDYDIAFSGVAWPPAWQRFHETQARLFLKRGREAYGAGRLNEAVLALSYAFERDPRLYEAGGLLAWLWQSSQPSLANRIYLQLIRDHPSRRKETAQRWYRALLNRGDFEAIGQLATEMLVQDPTDADAWTYALLFASRQQPSPALLDAALARSEPLPTGIRSLLQLEKRVRSASSDEARRALTASDSVTGILPFAFYHRIDGLIRLGYPTDALNVLSSPTGLDARTRARLRLDSLAKSGDLETRRLEIGAMLTPTPTLASVELLCAHLIRFPQAALTNELFASLEMAPLSPRPDHYTGYTALFCLAAVTENGPRCRQFGETLRQLSGAPLAFLPSVEAFFRGETEDKRMGTYLSRLQPLSLEVVCALYERQTDRAPAPVALRNE